MASSRVTAALRRVGLILSAVLVVALTAGVAAFARWLPDPVTQDVVVEQQEVGVGPTTWVCPPVPVLPTAAAGDDLDYDDELGTGGGTVATLVDLLALDPDGAAPGLTAGPIGADPADAVEGDAAGPLASLSLPGAAETVVGVVEPTDDGAVPLVGGLGLARADEGDIRGLTASTCQQPVTTALLVAGSTELGSSARLVLTNPGETAASVSLTGWGATGPLSEVAPVVVPAGGVREMLLQTISLEPRLAIRIDVEGGRVVPSIQDSALDGLVPAGTEMIGTTADPATLLALGPVSINDAPGASALLRLVNPGDEPATVAVEMLGPDGAEALEGAESSVVEPGTVVDISLAGVPNAQYGVRVTSDQPVTGAIRIARTGTAGEDDPDTPPVDVAWLPASAPLQRGVIPVPSDLVDSVAIGVANPAGEAVEVAVAGYDVAGQVVHEDEVDLPAGATARLEVPDDVVALVLSSEGVLASQTLVAEAGDGPLVAMVPMVPDPDIEQSVAVRVAG